jgi:hypothetical protein
VIRIAEVEVASAIIRRRNSGGVSIKAASEALAQLKRDFITDYVVVDVSDQLFAAAVSLVQIH